MRSVNLFTIVAALLLAVIPVPAIAGQQTPTTQSAATAPVDRQALRTKVAPAIDKALRYLADRQAADGRTQLRTYGSMTYAGFKSMLYANVDRNDPRVQQAWEWIRRHYTLEANPNMPGKQSTEGLYYYYHVFAKALQAWGEPAVVDAAGHRHDWRKDLCEQLLRVQHEDDSWVNTADRWQEGNAHLVTAYAVLALQGATQ